MGIPLKQAITVARYVATQRLKGQRRFPLVLMLEPLYRCNLACAGCGKIQHPTEVLRRHLSPEQCFAAAEECGAPIVSIAGGEPLLHPQIGEIVRGLLARDRIVYLCTNAILAQEKLADLEPDDGFILNVHLDGDEAHHDASVQRAGVYRTAVAAIHAAKARGLRVTVNCTIFLGHDVPSLHRFFDEVTAMGVDGIMVAPGYAYARAPDQAHFLRREQTRAFFAKVLAPAKERGWRFNHSPLYLEFLAGKRDYQCTPWGTPSYGLFGWQRPCYLMADGHVPTFKELMETTAWDRYGVGRDPRCANCMMHCGYEPTAVADSTSSVGNVVRSIRSIL